ncbi:MAG TPA: aspartate-semialdehyde dehydrogenase [Planctomycetes bacterium]|nr:aspartate-semialdehyde dehydrogenase [Planctomycetota bacterium]HIL37534.1 aspartate-semialdehyde dehydrogenase [Planctomycetota bacterium]
MNPVTPTRPLKLGILGATGLVGREMLRLVGQRSWCLGELRLIASERHAGQVWEEGSLRGDYLEASPEAFAGLDLLLSTARGDVSRRWLPEAVAAGVVCIDNTSAYRLDPDVPLVVPEVNGAELGGMQLGQGAIIANPNCSTIQLVVVLAPLLRGPGLRQVVVSTYQSISGAGAKALEDFEAGTRRALMGEVVDLPETVLNVVPQIGELDGQGHTEEERKMMNESARILGAEFPLDVTSVRVPVLRGHGESVWLETEQVVSLGQIEELLEAAPGVVLHRGDQHPTPWGISGDLGVHVGRVRAVAGSDRRFQLWIVGDNLLKGAAWNALQIAEARSWGT